MFDERNFNNDDKIILEYELRKTIEELEESLKIAEEERKKAELSDKLKTIFLANMSHEIRTPMNSIIGFSDLIINKKISKSEIHEYLKIINKNSEDLLFLLNDIIDISKIDVGEIKTDKKSFCLKKLIEEVYKDFSINKKLVKRNIKFKFDKINNVNVVTDRNRLIQIMKNLISNAIKFTEKGEVTFGCYIIRNNILKFYVKDTGIGIDKKYKDDIFDRFFQINIEEKDKKEGTGLGLSITKGLIKLLNGQISFKSIKNKGTIFYFTIPIEKSEKINTLKKEELYKEKKYDFSNKNILLSEDNYYNYLLFYQILKVTKCNLKWVKNGSECLEEYRTGKYDLILLDMRMPVISGYDVLKEIRKNDNNIPIISQTAYALSEDEEKLKEIGSTDYISKPINMYELLYKMSKYI